jgi:hypothetical protein
MPNDIVVQSWAELHDRLYEGAWREPIARFRSTYVYRGMPEASADLSHSLSRMGTGFERVELHMLRAFRKYARRDSVPGDSVWNWLALAQHHSLPTRLLDWTFSPYVALHFTTSDTNLFTCDGIVWCVDYVKAHSMLPRPLREQLDCEAAEVFTPEMLDRVAPTIPALDALEGDQTFVLFMEPPSLDDRLVNQFALFSAMSGPEAQLHEWLKDRPDLHRRLIIPAKLKREVRDKLDQANINERMLFPGLDGLGQYLSRYYSPRRD